jgi:hypothetical protein
MILDVQLFRIVVTEKIIRDTTYYSIIARLHIQLLSFYLLHYILYHNDYLKYSTL